MTAYFRSKPDSGPVEIAEIGLLPALGAGGIPITDVAKKAPQLQNAAGHPLEGDALIVAARQYATHRGLVLAGISEADGPKPNPDQYAGTPDALPVEPPDPTVPDPPDETPHDALLAEIAREEEQLAEDRAQLETETLQED